MDCLRRYGAGMERKARYLNRPETIGIHELSVVNGAQIMK